ncbi:MAG: hypothetical protein HWN68_18965 [Desulfobacterales bacterium]|nr:hypothetical protein [Desulfobacterales bacterium]
MSPKTESWELLFCAGYIVWPCKGLEPDAVQDRVAGSPINVDTIPTSFFLPLFAESAERCPIDIGFALEGEKQENTVRNLVRSIAFDEPTKKAHAAQELAYRLACATTRRSPLGLFVVLAGQANEHTRVLLWKFPADESLQARISAGGITIRLIQDAFSRKSTYFKAAMFEGTPARTTFWRGKIEDKQAKHRVTEAADFWIADFLSAKPALTDARGTRLLARALRETVKQTKSVEIKEDLVAAAVAIKSQVDRNISLDEFASSYLPKDARPIFIEKAGGPALADAIFRIDRATLERELRFKSIVLDNLFIIKGPLDRFDDVVDVEPTDQEGVVEVSLRGTITSQAVQTR